MDQTTPQPQVPGQMSQQPITPPAPQSVQPQTPQAIPSQSMETTLPSHQDSTQTLTPSPKRGSPYMVTLVVIIIIMIIGAIGLLYAMYQPKTPSATQSMYNPQSTKQVHVSPSPEMSATTATNNAQLTQDSQTIDQSLNTLHTDVNTADQSLTDKSVDLSQ